MNYANHEYYINYINYFLTLDVFLQSVDYVLYYDDYVNYVIFTQGRKREKYL